MDGQGFCWTFAGDAGVVDPDVDGAALFDNRLHEAGAFLR